MPTTCDLTVIFWLPHKDNVFQAVLSLSVKVRMGFTTTPRTVLR